MQEERKKIMLFESKNVNMDSFGNLKTFEEVEKATNNDHNILQEYLSSIKENQDIQKHKPSGSIFSSHGQIPQQQQ